MIKIEEISVILTQPGHSPLAIVKVETSEPGLYGLGCATFARQIYAVEAAIVHRLKPLLVGRDVSRIGEIWHLASFDGYYRHGAVLNNAISGIDMALWDIKGKVTGLPLYDVFGGKVREGANVYVHTSAPSIEGVLDKIRDAQLTGHRHFRVQLGVYGGVRQQIPPPEGAAVDDNYFDPRSYMADTIELLTEVRATFGDEIEILHDVHERLSPVDAMRFTKELEPFKLFFLEDVLAPEDNDWFKHIRSQSATRLAMGEIYTNPREYQPVVAAGDIDFIRVHPSYIGGITPAWKLAALAELSGVRTAWHGPSGTSPVGHAANLHLELWAPNFGIHEWYGAGDLDYEMFPGLPVVRDGYMYPNDQPGLGIDIDEALAAEHPPKPLHEYNQQLHVRLPDGTPARP